MKFSLSWIFDHINADQASVDVTELINRFNRITAEIEHVEHQNFHPELFTLVQIISIETNNALAFSPELDQKFNLPLRNDLVVHHWFLANKQGNQWQWAKLSDLHSTKEGLMPALSCSVALSKGQWKKLIPAQDVIIEVDNKSITHRPDLWSHRGMAREVAAILGFSLKPLEQFLQITPVEFYDTQAKPNANNPCELGIEAPNACKRLAALYLSKVENKPSDILMACKIARVDSKPINAIVDITNYVMFDLGLPLHAYDVNALSKPILVARMARAKEKLTLLDGETIELSNKDLVISDDTKPLGLAGIMGGKASGITLTTHTIIVEAACFDASTIRHTAARVKKRTEAAARFEKSLDPEQTIQALQRFLALAKQLTISLTAAPAVSVVGKSLPRRVLTVPHAFIEKRLGTTIDSSFIVNTMRKLEFEVSATGKDEIIYTLTVPSFRATKDITINEDIVEEVARFFGYDTLNRTLPRQELAPWDMTPIMRMRAIKGQFAYGLQMREVYNYALYDEQFLQQLDWQPEHTLAVQSPLSENWQRLVTSLIPHLLKNVTNNSSSYDILRFFEFGRCWQTITSEVDEKKIIAGIMVDQKNSVDFYVAKQELQTIFDLLHLSIAWVQIEQTQDPWFAPYESAYLMHNDTCIGKAGKMNKLMLNRVVPGDAFAFELDAHFLTTYQPNVKKYTALSKYPDVHRDISMLIPSTITADHILTTIRNAHNAIVVVELVDHFINEAWKDRKALTIRITLRDYQKTLTKEEIDQIVDGITKLLIHQGATIR